MKTLAPLATRERKQLFKITAATPRTLEYLVLGLSAKQLVRRPERGFSLHQHVWHLADLEREAYATRIERLLNETEPRLADFNGQVEATARDYHRLPLKEALRAFADARLHNLWILSGVNHAQWVRRGVLEGAGPTSLADIFRHIAAHDEDHLQAMQALLRQETSAA